jgi:pimeloyl-ACP methyl ester carboxylesterase
LRSSLAGQPVAGAVIAGAILAVVASCACRSQHADSAARGGSLAQEPCTAIQVAEARCFRLAVPENWSNAAGRVIQLRVVVLSATGSNRVPDPIFYLAGGPGQAATELLHDPSWATTPLRERRDLVFADQRGTGESNPLTCRFYGPPEDVQSYFQAFLPIDKVRECRAALERTADLAQYTTTASVDDLEAIRTAFGYPQINLIGGSYGTRLAMEYVRRHEAAKRVRTVVLESPVTPRIHAPENFGQLAARALEARLDECARSPRCASDFPRIRDEARAVFERLRQGPVTATVAHPARQIPTQVTLNRDHVGEAIRYMMYSSAGAARVPEYLHEASTGNYSPIAQFLLRWRADGTFDGLYLSITCAEDVPLVAPDAADRDDPTYLGGYRVRQQRAACAEWPRGEASNQSREPVTSAVPTLITSGDLDPVTPPANGDEISRTLSNSLHVRVPSSGHSPAGLTGLECLANLKRAFIEGARTDGLDTSCVSRIARP